MAPLASEKQYRVGRIRIFKGDLTNHDDPGVYVSRTTTMTAVTGGSATGLIMTTDDHKSALNVRVTALTDGVALWADNLSDTTLASGWNWLAIARSISGTISSQPKALFPLTLATTLKTTNTTVPTNAGFTATELRTQAWSINIGENIDVLWVDDSDNNNYVYRFYAYVGAKTRLLTFSANGTLDEGAIAGTASQKLIPVHLVFESIEDKPDS